MTQSEVILWIGLGVLGMAGSFLWSGFETGSYSVNRVRLALRARRKAKDPAAAILKAELDHPARLLSTLLVSNNLFNYFIAISATALLEGAGYSGWSIVALNAALVTPLLFVVCESVPKEWFRVEADRLCYRLAPVVAATRLVLTATLVLPLVMAWGRIAMRVLGVRESDIALSARQRLAATIKEGARHGVLSETQTTLVDRAVTFSATTVRDEVVPWLRVDWIGVSWPAARIAALLAGRPHSRFPVVDGAGRVIGLVEHLDVCLSPSLPIAELVKPIIRLAPSLPVRDALAELARQNARLAIVGDPRRPLGIVTPRDLTEPLTGP